MGSFIDVAFDATSLSSIAKLLEAEIKITAEMTVALRTIGEMLVSQAQANTWTAFQNPTGQLASTIMMLFDGPLTIEVGSDSPYARRLEEGFAGTDSIGRTYNNPAEPYLITALQEHEDEIAVIISLAIAESFAGMGINL